ncbi:MAG: hypothetical protein ABIW03_02375, partial [Sphingomicrobium sp.]
TPVGFHDAYVAAPSRKAALAAWGSGTDLFAAGAAEVVSDPELMKEALARPGEVIRKSRGTGAEHVRALGKVAKNRPSPNPSREREGRKKPRPSRAAVEKAEKAVEAAKAEQQEAAVRLRTAEQALEEARRRYRAAMAESAD